MVDALQRIFCKLTRKFAVTVLDFIFIYETWTYIWFQITCLNIVKDRML
jgi:hypothetical protein